MKPRGISLHVGLNSVDGNHYAGWEGPLRACEADAEDMRDIATSRGFDTMIMLTKKASRKSVTSFLEQSSKDLKDGDILLITYSGHGGQVRDISGDEDDQQDETWCLFDGQLLDDELYLLWSRFARGVRIFVLSDSCHSGTMLKSVFYAAAKATVGDFSTERIKATSEADEQAFRFMPPEISLRTYRKNKDLYDGINNAIRKNSGGEARTKIAASVRLISGCQDNQLSMDGTFNGAFTGALLQVWNNGRFDGNYDTFHRSIQAKLPPSQSPNHMVIGQQNSAFDAQVPFSIRPEG
jgi:hypothetical protein